MAADLIDMGPDPAATSSLSSQLAGMSKCSVRVSGLRVPYILRTPLQLWGCRPITQLQLECQQQNLGPDPSSPGSSAESFCKAERPGQNTGDPPLQSHNS